MIHKIYNIYTVQIYIINIKCHMNIYKEIYHKVLDHTIVEAEKSHDMPRTSWQPKEVSGVIRKTEGQRANSTDCSRSLKASEPGAPREGKNRCPSSFRQEESKSNLPLQGPVQLDNAPMHAKEGHLLYSTQFRG